MNAYAQNQLENDEIPWTNNAKDVIGKHTSYVAY